MGFKSAAIQSSTLCRTFLLATLLCLILPCAYTQDVTCENPLPFHKGTFRTTGSGYNDTVTYACKPGYFYVGEKHATCRKDGTWSHGSGQCEEVKCIRPPINGGSYKIDNGNHSVIIPQCPAGKTYSGSHRLICVQNNTWQGTIGNCLAHHEIFCNKYIPGGPATVTPDSETVLLNHYIYITCPKGHLYTGTTKRQCLFNGTWSGLNGTCQKRECPPYSYKEKIPMMKSPCSPCFFGQKIEFECPADQQYRGGVVECGEHGRWIGQPGHCIKEQCLTKPLQHGSYHSVAEKGQPEGSSYAVDDVITPRCDHVLVYTGQVLVYTGQSQYKCIAPGKWDGPFGVCTEMDKIRCKPIQKTKGMTVEPQLTDPRYNAVVNIRCSGGANYTGSTRRECQANGTWSGSDGQCHPRGDAGQNGSTSIQGTFLCLLICILTGFVT